VFAEIQYVGNGLAVPFVPRKRVVFPAHENLPVCPDRRGPEQGDGDRYQFCYWNDQGEGAKNVWGNHSQEKSDDQAEKRQDKQIKDKCADEPKESCHDGFLIRIKGLKSLTFRSGKGLLELLPKSYSIPSGILFSTRRRFFQDL